MRRMRTAAAFAAVAALGLGACSAGSGDEAGDEPGGDSDASAAPTDSADDSGADTGADSGGTDAPVGDSEAPADSTATTDEVTATQAGDLTFHMITHSDDGPFWTVVQNGAEQAAEDLGVNLVWMGSNNDPEQQVQLIAQAVSEGTDGIAAALPSPDQLTAPLTEATESGIPLVTLNSGVDYWKDVGAITHVGQTELIAGQGAGERFNELGATKVLCGVQEQSNVALEERCAGVAETFEGEVVTDFMGLDANTTEQQNTISAQLQADEAFDAFIGTGPVIGMSGLRAAQELGRDMHIGAFDVTTELIDAIEAGDVAFTIDQQQYVQGYLPVLLLYLNVTNANVVGGGQPILTGPGFIDAENAAEVKELVAQATR